MTAPEFDTTFRETFEQLLVWRRDVRRFRTDPVPEALLAHLLDLACLAPSVGNSQPWRFVWVRDPERRAVVRASFERCNAAALAAQPADRAAQYARLKLEGLDRAPEQFAVYCDESTGQGHGLGSRTMPETLRYSTVNAINTLWLAARAHGLGLGWVSIVAPDAVNATLDVPAGWTFIGYFCLGWPEVYDDTPKLERHGWQARTDACRTVLER